MVCARVKNEVGKENNKMIIEARQAKSEEFHKGKEKQFKK